jgi:hypothetical protein
MPCPTTSWNEPSSVVTSSRVSSKAVGSVRPSSGMTCTAMRSPPLRFAIRAPRRISDWSSGRPETPTRIRSRASHGPSIP